MQMQMLFCKRSLFCPLSWAWERSPAGPDGIVNGTRPSDKFLQESTDWLKKHATTSGVAAMKGKEQSKLTIEPDTFKI
jgi:hypothetical protein